MDFPQKYQLIELLPGEGVESYRARQTNTGRDVTVHLLVGGKTPENEAFLVRLRGMQPQPMAKLIEVGEYQGAAFVVTVAPPYQRLDEWLAEQDRAAVVKDFGKAGFWKRPEAGSLAPPPMPPAATPAAPEPGEFTKQFGRGAAPGAEPGLPATPPQSPAPPPSWEPGESTRMFRSPVALPAPEPAVPAARPPVLPPDAPGAGPGEFTRLFQAPPSPQAGPPPTPEPLRTPPPAAGPGEFTRMFHSPMPDVPAQGAWPLADAKPQEPGEFTLMFQAPSLQAGPQRPEAGTPAPQGGEFTQFFKPSPGGMPAGPQFPSASQFPVVPSPEAGSPPAPPPPQQESGEYTRMFGPGTLSGPPEPIPAAPQAPAPPASYGPGGGATQAFRATPVNPPAAAPHGPSEYTRMMSVPSNLAPPPPVAPPAAAPPAGQMPGMPRMGMPPMPYTQPPAMPQQPAMPRMPHMPQMAPSQAPAPPVSASLGKSPNTLLIVIFCLLAFLAGGIVVYLLVRRG